MKNRSIALLVVLVASLVAVGARNANAAPSQPLTQSLRTLRSLGDDQFGAVVAWSRNGASRPFFASTPVQHAEVQILDLPQADRNAALSWLRGDGRQALYARGATDADVGDRRPQLMASATPTPNPYRTLTFTSAGLGNSATKGIEVLAGWAAVKRDGKSAVVCVSFKNVASAPARRVLFEFPLYGPRGRELGELQLDRRGEFSSGVDINGWSGLSDWQSGVGHRGFGDNCTVVEQGVASQPLLSAASASYRILEVER